MSDSKLGQVEKQVLRALKGRNGATSDQIATLLGNIGASSIVSANAALVRNKLVEPVPNEQGAFRLTSEGAKLADHLPAERSEPGSGGGDSSFN